MKDFKGTLALARIALRRDRIQLPVWILAMAAFMAAFLPTWTGYFEIEEELRAAIEVFAANPAARLFGIASGVGLGEFVMLEGFVTLSVVAALMSFLAVIRHTRQNEDTGRAEFVGSAAVGRHASLAAALIVTIGANVIVAIAVALLMIANDLPATGSFAMGAAVGGVGVSFAGVAAVTAQVYSTSRAANGMAAAVLVLGFILSGIGNILGRYDEAAVWVHSAWPSWLSPIGWGQQMRPFAENHWWMLGLFGVLFLVLTAAAFFLDSRRDMGRGLLPEGRGPAMAAPGLLSLFGLVWRLQRGLFFGWAAGMVVIGVIFGSISGEIEAFDSEALAELFERLGGTAVILDAYFATVMGIVGMLMTVYTLQVLLRMRREEADGPLESVLATAVSRRQWMMSYIGNAVLGTTALLLLIGLSAGLSAGLALGNIGEWTLDFVVAGLVQLPAILVIAGVVVLAFSFLPRWVGLLGWGAFLLALITGPVIGGLLNLSESVRNISPFTHTPQMPAAAFEAAPVLIMVAIAVIPFITGLAAFRRRDLSLQTE